MPCTLINTIARYSLSIRRAINLYKPTENSYNKNTQYDWSTRAFGNARGDRKLGDGDAGWEREIAWDFDASWTKFADREYCAVFGERNVGWCFRGWERGAGSGLRKLLYDLLAPDTGALLVFEFEIRVVAG